MKAPSTAYHGCLAGLVKAPQTEEEDGPPPTVFAYMKKLVADLMHEHVYPELIRA